MQRPNDLLATNQRPLHLDSHANTLNNWSMQCRLLNDGQRNERSPWDFVQLTILPANNVNLDTFVTIQLDGQPCTPSPCDDRAVRMNLCNILHTLACFQLDRHKILANVQLLLITCTLSKWVERERIRNFNCLQFVY